MPPQRGASASPPTASTLSRDRHAPAQPKKTLIKQRWPSPAATAPTLRGHGVQAPARFARLFGRACVPALPCGATVRATCYLWGTAPPPRAPHPTRRCYAVAAHHLLPAPTPPRIGGGVRALASLRSSGNPLIWGRGAMDTLPAPKPPPLPPPSRASAPACGLGAPPSGAQHSRASLFSTCRFCYLVHFTAFCCGFRLYSVLFCVIL